MNIKYKILAAFAVCCVLAAIVWFLIEYDLFYRLTALVNEKTPAALFIPLMVFLPLIGVPLSFFLFLIGVRFGVVNGLLLLEASLPLHMLISYLLSRAVRRPIESYLVNRKNYQIPEVPEDKELMFSFFFLTFPVFPYAVKLYMLPLAGVKFRYCFWLNWAIQGTLCIPFVLLGRSAADLNVVMFGVTAVIFLVMFIFLRWARKQYVKLENEKTI